MASIDEVLQAAQYQKRSPLQAILEGFTKGFGGGYQNAPAVVEQGLKIKAMQDQQRREDEAEQEVKKILDQKTEAATQQNFKGAAGGQKPVHPAAKFKLTYTQNEKGGYSRKIEQVDPGAAAGGANPVYDAAQLKAISEARKTKDITKLADAFPNGVPDAVVKQVSAGERIDNLEGERDVRGGERRQGRFRNYLLDIEQRDPVIKQLRKEELGLAQVDDMLALVKEGNTVAASAVGTKMARGMGEVGVLTESDITRYVESGKITRKVGDKLLRMVRGTPTEATQEEIGQIAEALRDSFHTKVAPRYNQYVDSYATQERMKPEDFARELKVPYTGRKPGGDGADIEAKRAALRQKLGLAGGPK